MVDSTWRSFFYWSWLVTRNCLSHKKLNLFTFNIILITVFFSFIGSGLHTFVLYLGPHIALFTLKATLCGRVDLKSAPYDTIQLKRVPSWLDRSCSEFGPPLMISAAGSRVPLTSILPQVQLEAILWGIGTALGELPPYFISRAGSYVASLYIFLFDLWYRDDGKLDWIFRQCMSIGLRCLLCFGFPYFFPASISGSRVDGMEDLDASSSEDSGFMATYLNRIKRWLLTHSQHLNFFTVLVLASVSIHSPTYFSFCISNHVVSFAF